ncbi:hypothetical protein KKD52_07435, partial [Myxococcota bacterium]|nr:hypothetical protein [Myxococcota bacterium]
CIAVDPLECGERGCLPATGCCPQGTHVEDGACVLDDTGPRATGNGCGCVTGSPRTRSILFPLLLAGFLLWRRRPRMK